MREVSEGMVIADRWRVVTALEVGSAPSWRVVGPDGRDGEFLMLPGISVEELDEACRAVAGVQHENLVRPLESFEWDGVACLVRELPAGISLDEWMRREQRLDMDQALGIACQLCLVATEAAKRGIGFVGFAPERIVVTVEGFAKVDPNGRLFVPADDPWRSPEERRGDKGSASSDLFRIAVLIHAMLDGARPKIGPDGVTLNPIHDGDASMHAELDEILQHATAVDPGARPADATVLLDKLHPLLMGRPEPGSDIPTRWYEDKRFWLYVTGGLLALLALAALFTGQMPFFRL